MNTIRLSLKSAAWLSIFAVFVITVIPIEYRPATGFSPDVERFSAMVVVGTLFVSAYPERFWMIALGLSAAIAIFEPLQLLVHGRHASLGDVDLKVLGAVVGVTLGHATNAIIGRLLSQKP